MIGQAWCLEALLRFYDIFSDSKLLEVAESVFSAHQQSDLGLWYVASIDGADASLENTLNQQIWMASIAALLSVFNSSYARYVTKFLDSFPNTYGAVNGVMPLAVYEFEKSKQSLLSRMRRCLIREYPREREARIGYHIFSLAGLAVISQSGFKEHKYFKSSIFESHIDILTDSEFIAGLAESRFGYQYNVPGFELIHVLEVFGSAPLSRSGLAPMNEILNRQIENHLNQSSKLMSRNTIDPITLASRVYEIYRISDLARKLEQ